MFTKKTRTSRIETYKRYFKATLFTLWILLFIGGITVTIWFLRDHSLEEAVATLENILETRQNMLAISLFILFLVRTIIYIPVSLLGALTGVIFHEQQWLAFAFALIGSALSGAIAFGLARMFGRKWVVAHENMRWQHFDEAVRKRGFLTIFVARLLIFIPFDLVSLAAGVSAMRFRSFFWGTLLGIIPEVTAQILVGTNIMNPWNLLVIGVFLLLGLFLAYFLKTHPHFRDLINPVRRLRQYRERYKKKTKLKGGRKKRF